MPTDPAIQRAFEHHQSGRLPQAEELYRQILTLHPNDFNATHLLGALAFQMARYPEASELLRRAISLNPASAPPYYHLGCVLQAQNQFTQAIVFYRLAIARKENYAEAWNNLGNAHKDLGEIPEALAALRKAVEINPAAMNIHSNLLLTLWYDPTLTIDAIAAEHFRWNDAFAKPLATPPNFPNDKSHTRRLRIGYVSPDFRQHPVTSFMEPLLANHDHAAFEIFCYSHPLRFDDVTARFHQYADHWREIANLTDDQSAALIRQDQIDLLIDLAGHTAGNRLGIFARKPAPIQVSYLGYIGTTGLSTIDYRIADIHTDPHEEKLPTWYSEKLLRLPTTFAAYQPPESALDLNPNPSPASTTGHITFASLNALGKITPDMLDTWATILHNLPNSRLLMVAIGLQDTPAQTKLRHFFESRGISPDRLELHGFIPHADYLALHHRIDILLDTFPINGHTITTHALWMGVPVITQAGQTYASRLGAATLTNLNLPDLIATSPEDYAKKALTLAQNPSQLATLRATLRQRMQSSPLLNAPALTREIESTYRNIWQTHCTRH